MTNPDRSAGRIRIVPGPTNSDQRAVRVAERAAEMWRRHHGCGDIDLPLSTVAALALLTPPDPERDGVAREWIELSTEEFRQRVCGLWNWVAITRPDLLNPVWPLMSVWLDERRPIGPEDLVAVKHVADAVLGADLIGLTGTAMRFETDLLGSVLTLLRPPAAWRDRGQYYTPSDISAVVSACLWSDPSGSQRRSGPDASHEDDGIHDPTCGTGGMIRAAAQQQRQAGRDPHAAVWTGCDIDPLAIGCCAVNAIVWDLGPKVILACGDTLAWDGFFERAVAARQEMIDLTRGLVRDRMRIGLLRDTRALLDRAAEHQRRSRVRALDPDRTAAARRRRPRAAQFGDEKSA